ncbi:NTP transferase domain-containing protein [Wenzhouxiangella sp. XN79A]|uniref:NTP transferase domain-containing protein n=1 Tax=Wenzhouxiangella sp. XN79A TaxID=2724193 RepID=UPI00144AE1D8|nr:NTP transferase domain-containing protein [Wenzhouxiangella sp. XN79A]NKI36004.1 NTP transferase domain-containing protein [Wenzhouxiangella sp. XN79A]
MTAPVSKATAPAAASRPAIIVLAGDRGPGDPLAASAGVAGKVLVPVAGRPMLAHVLDAARGLGDDVAIRLVCPARPEYTAVAEPFGGCAGSLQTVEPASGPAASVAAALATLPADGPVLLLTGDHPLLTREWLRGFLAAAEATGADAVVGLADADAVRARFPEGRRTRYRFADRSVCGTNLFLFRTAQGRRVVETWQAFERDRKKPWRIVGRLGPVDLLRYLLRRLSLAGAFEALSRRLDARAAPVIVPWPEAAVDVDTPADKVLVESVFRQRAS